MTAAGLEGGGSLSSLRERRQGAYTAARLGEVRIGSLRVRAAWRVRGGAEWGADPQVSFPLIAWGRTSGPPSRVPACPVMRATPKV